MNSNMKFTVKVLLIVLAAVLCICYFTPVADTSFMLSYAPYISMATLTGGITIGGYITLPPLGGLVFYFLLPLGVLIMSAIKMNKKISIAIYTMSMILTVLWIAAFVLLNTLEKSMNSSNSLVGLQYSLITFGDVLSLIISIVMFVLSLLMVIQKADQNTEIKNLRYCFVGQAQKQYQQYNNQPVTNAQPAPEVSSGQICPVCGNMVPEGDLYCMSCGTKIETKQYCQECGKELKPGSMFCQNCGRKV